MKPALVFIGGVATGMIALLGWQKIGTGELARRSVAAPASARLESQSQAQAPWNPKKRQVMEFEYGKPQFVTDGSGTTYQLSLTGLMGAPVEYRWLNLRDKREGSGVLFEKLEELRKTEKGREVRDLGQGVIAMDSVHLEWSPKEVLRGWIYFDSAEVSIGTERPGERR